MVELDLVLTRLENERIISVYRGRVGCCCGCRGTHYRGEELTPRRVSNAIRDLSNAADHMLFEADNHVGMKRDGRYVIIYLEQ